VSEASTGHQNEGVGVWGGAVFDSTFYRGWGGAPSIVKISLQSREWFFFNGSGRGGRDEILEGGELTRQ